MVSPSNRTASRLSSLIEAGCWLTFIFLAFLYTFDFDDPLPVYDLGPAHWPRMVLLGMLIAGSTLLYSDWKKRHQSVQKDSVDNRNVTQTSMSLQIRILLIFVLPVFYTFLIHKLGFLLVTPFFLFVYMWLIGVNRLKTLIVCTLGIYAALVIIFVKLIFTYLPPGAGIFNTINGKILGLLM